MQSRGLSIVELVVAAAIILVVVTGATSAWHLYFSLSTSSASQTQAALLTEEASEALNLLRDKSWSANVNPLANNTTYYIYWNGSTYATSTSPVIVNQNYLVSFILGPIYRNGLSDITDSSGTLDTGSRFATITVAYAGNASTTIMQTNIILHNMFQN